MKKTINVAKQKHYIQHPLQPIEFCEINKLGWCASNIIKYVCRYQEKSGLQDLEKAKVYLETLIQYTRTGKFITPDKL